MFLEKKIGGNTFVPKLVKTRWLWNCLCRLEHVPLVVTTSTLTPDEKKSLKQHIIMLGGHTVSSWQDTVTHVTMCSLTLTVKVGSSTIAWTGEVSFYIPVI